MKRRLNSDDREWRYTYVDNQIRQRNIDKLNGKWRAFHMRATGFMPSRAQNQVSPALRQRLTAAFLERLTMPKNAVQRHTLAGVFPDVTVVRCVDYGLAEVDLTFQNEFSVLAYRMCDLHGAPTSYRSRQQMKHYMNGQYTFVHEAQLIYPVPPEEFAQWPEVREIQVDAYKRFTITQNKKVSPMLAVQGDVITGDVHASIRGYHTTRDVGYIKLGEINPRYPTFGCELELVPTRAFRDERRGRTSNRYGGAQTVATRILADCGDVLDIEHDGSVSSGFEIVSGYGHFEALDSAMRRVYKLHIEKSVLGITRGTGLHFHVGWRKINHIFLAKLYSFVSRYRQIIVVVAGREPNRFCPIYSIKVDRIIAQDGKEMPQWAGARLPVDRYNAINTQRWDEGSVPRFEWRSPKATTSYAAWRGRLEFIYHLTSWLATTDDEEIPAMEDFMAYLKRRDRESTVGLRRTLCSAAGQAVLTNMRLSRTQLTYNSRVEYPLLRL